MGIKIMVANQKGGVGKTTTALETATCMAEQGFKVLLVDLDQQCNLTTYLNADDRKPNIYDVLSAKTTLEEAICEISDTENLYFIKGSPQLSKADKEFGESEDVFLLDTLFDLPEAKEYNYIIIDTNPARNTLLKMCYCSADYVVFATECDKGSIDGITALYNDIRVFKNLKVPFSHTEVLGVILNKFEPTSMHKLAMENIEEMASEMNPNAFVMSVRKSIVVSEAKLYKESLQKYKPWSNPAMDFRDITNKIIKLAV